MCGVTGIIYKGGVNAQRATNIVKYMSDALVHRGPDDSGIWIDEQAGVVLAHRRLSILDLSSAGHQPMSSRSGRYVLVFNGEIYNHNELRAELHSSVSNTITYNGNSDTETLLVCIEEWGLEVTLGKMVGMFAIALWDKEKQQLVLVRDRMGEKPLYYGMIGKHFVFSSELKSITAHPEFQDEIDRDALSLYFRHNYIPTPYTIWKGIKKLQPGSYLILKNDCSEAEIFSYWSINDAVKCGVESPFTGTPDDAVDELEKHLSRSIAGQMISDVPLGAFLSGGVDSSTVVALMQEQSSRPIKTFSIGFHEDSYNEAKYAKEVAKHLGTEHTEIYVTPKQAMDVIPLLPTLYDEPFADSSQIPTFLLSQMTKEHVTVSLSGDGGDELFCGYNRYEWADTLWNNLNRFPAPMRIGLSKLICFFPPKLWDKVFRTLSFLIPNKYQYGSPGDKIHKLAELFSVNTPEEIYYHLVSHWKHPSDIVLNSQEPPTVLTNRDSWVSTDSFEDRMMYLDQRTYLTDDILVKVDRAAMGVSLETRVPMLDHRVVEFAWKLPLDYKLRDGQTKWPLRQLLYRYVPKKLIERPKMGFGIPIDEWLRGPLREWAEELLDQTRIKNEGYLDSVKIKSKWDDHLSGRRNWAYYLWDVLMFQSWLENQRK